MTEGIPKGWKKLHDETVEFKCGRGRLNTGGIFYDTVKVNSVLAVPTPIFQRGKESKLWLTHQNILPSGACDMNLVELSTNNNIFKPVNVEIYTHSRKEGNLTVCYYKFEKNVAELPGYKLKLASEFIDCEIPVLKFTKTSESGHEFLSVQ